MSIPASMVMRLLKQETDKCTSYTFINKNIYMSTVKKNRECNEPAPASAESSLWALSQDQMIQSNWNGSNH